MGNLSVQVFWKQIICAFAYIGNTDESCGIFRNFAIFSVPSVCFKVREPPKLLELVHFSRGESWTFLGTKNILKTRHLSFPRFLLEGYLAAIAAMPHEVKVRTLEGGVLTVEVLATNTIKELKAMLHEKKHCGDPIERQILKVKVLADGLLVNDDQTLESAGLLHDDSEVTVIYSRNEVEAATTEAIRAEGRLQVNIPPSLTEISASAFEWDTKVVKVAIPESVTVIGDCAFFSCSSLASITIPDSVTLIGDNAFQFCSSLENITIPDSVTVIGNSSFRGCTSLTSVTIPDSVTVIGNSSFRGCTSLTSVTIPDSVTLIGDNAFFSCSSLASVTIPDSVTLIGYNAFDSCSSLENITIPGSATSTGDSSFRECTSLQTL